VASEEAGLWQYTPGWGGQSKINDRRRSLGADPSPNLVGLPQLSPCKQGNSLRESFEFPPSVEFLLGDSSSGHGLSPKRRNRRNSACSSSPVLPSIDGLGHALPAGWRRRASCSPAPASEDLVSQLKQQTQNVAGRRRHSCAGVPLQNAAGRRRNSISGAGWAGFDLRDHVQSFSPQVGSELCSSRPLTAGELDLCEDGGGLSTPKYKGRGALAQALVKQCGSLERAFGMFDYNHQGKITHSQWVTGLALLRLDVDVLCGISSKSFFKMIDSKHKLEVNLDAWTTFFRQLEGTDAAGLLTEDNGPREALRKSRSSKRRASFSCTRSLEMPDSFTDDEAAVAAAGVHAAAHEVAASGVNKVGTAGRHRRKSAAAVLGCSQRRLLTDADEAMSSSFVNCTSEDAMGDSNLTDSLEGSNDAAKQSGGVAKQSADAAKQSGGPPKQSGGAAKQQAPVARLCSTGPGSDTDSCFGEDDARVHGSPSMQRRPGCTAATGISPGRTDGYPVQGAQSAVLPGNASTGQPSADQSIAARSSTQDDESARLQGFEPPTESKAEGANVDEPDLCDLCNLNDEELDAMGEQEQLKEEIASLNISGVQALAYVIIAKLQSFKKAFKWFDTNSHGSLAPFCWETGIKLLRIDMRTLTGLNVMEVYVMMDSEPRNGSVTWKKFKHFFAAVNSGKFAQSLAKAQGLSKSDCLAERSMGKKKALRQLQEQQRGLIQPRDSHVTMAEIPMQLVGSDTVPMACDGVQGVHDDSSGGTLHSRSSSKRQQPQGRSASKATSDQLDETATSDAERYSDCSFQGGHGNGSSPRSNDMNTGPLDSSRSSASSGSGDEEEMVGGYEHTYRERIRLELSHLALGESLEYTASRDSLECSIIQEVAEELGMWSHTAQELPVPLSARGGFKRDESGEWPGAVFVCNLRQFAIETRDQLVTIEAGEHLEFCNSLSDTQRRVVHMLASGFGLWTHSEGKGAQRRVFAFNLGVFAEEIRQDLESLGSGQSKSFPLDFSVA